jgi:hypothetical protein
MWLSVSVERAMKLKWLVLTGVASVAFALGAMVTVFAIDRDPQGEATSNCDRVQAQAINNDAGMTVSTHTTACTTLGTTIATYVYVHPTGSVETKENLVFRFAEVPGKENMQLSWLGPNKILIRCGEIGSVTRLETTIGAISIKYEIGGSN